MRFTLIGLVFFGMFSVPVLGQGDADELLKKLTAKSELVLSVDIVDVKRNYGKAGVGSYICGVKVREVLRGTKPKDEEILVQIVLIEVDEKEPYRLLKKGEKCVLFLRNAGNKANPLWTNTERWFSVQPDSKGLRMMVGSLGAKK